MRTRALYLSTALAAGLLAAACQRADTAANSPATAPVDSTAAAAPAAAPAANPVIAADFVTAAAGSDMYEIAAAKVAQQKSKSAAIKAFAAKMIHDHSATTAEVKKLIASGKVKATPPTAMDDKHQGMINDLNQAAPGAFDKTYMDQQVAAHTDALGVFQTYASSGDNTDLKAFAAATAPKIQGHLDMAKQIDSGLK
ncbi:MAG: DUF4142 domain-containing protein [Caulobacteraceae bacterium]